jgi:predicted amidophosphoribosyltransferase
LYTPPAKPIEHALPTQWGYSLPVWSAHTYINPTSEHVVHQAKYKGNPLAYSIQAEAMGAIIIKSILPVLPAHIEKVLLLPAPSSYMRTIARGYSHTKEITHQCLLYLNQHAPNIEWQQCPPLVQRTLYAPPHAHYGKHERLQSAEHTFKANYRVCTTFKKHIEKDAVEGNASPAIIMLDDVSTTGATLRAMAHIVLAHIPNTHLSACTYAYTPLAHTSFTANP